MCCVEDRRRTVRRGEGVDERDVTREEMGQWTGRGFCGEWGTRVTLPYVSDPTHTSLSSLLGCLTTAHPSLNSFISYIIIQFQDKHHTIDKKHKKNICGKKPWYRNTRAMIRDVICSRSTPDASHEQPRGCRYRAGIFSTCNCLLQQMTRHAGHSSDWPALP